ncbi:hypothetical protein ParKJ_23220 [Paraburkholderia fungorum]|jgi:hypothetical protein|uniref:Uncharacterized protein n=1 Tax=Paraburkholderia fungorum TaxID=134537 RepID=A0AAP5UVX6_9BURK|nr:hypothetical protein [Paraburkholderia fungorum]MDT8840341.1 hypothetical protein [Paraburkholderia fungorum]
MLEDIMWLFINLVLPVTAPILGMWLEIVSARNIRDDAERLEALRRRRIVMLFKDGQLGWVGLLMCFAAVSDMLDGIRRHGLPVWAPLVVVALLGLVYTSGYFATKGAVDTAEALDDFAWRRFPEDYPSAFYTIIFTLISAVLFAGTHFWAQ